ncbi:MAG TPA: molecular chaperone DnaJ [Terriglobales bacterium]|nr:molecular chaperone DnaJ [Terriglobales bacterium]
MATMAGKRDYYEVLGVGRDADEQQIKSAYRRLALQYHPDRNREDPAAEEKFKEASEAYSVLCDPQKRAQYDRFGHAGVGTGTGNGGDFDPSLFADFSDIFGDFFGFGDLFGGGARRRPGQARRGSDLRYELELTFEEALFGAEKTLRFTRLTACGECKGRGTRKGAAPTPCATCGGRGQVRYQQGFFSIARTCSSCGGAGTVIRDPCPACHGRGRIEQETQKQVTIPAGIDEGHQLRLSGEGEAGLQGGPNGDLYVAVRIQPHPFFERRETELYCHIPISFPQAVLGCDLTVPSPWGEEKVQVPAGTTSGTELPPLRGKGVPRLNGRGRGDLHVIVDLEVPRKLTREQRLLIEQLAEALPNDNRPRERGLFEKVRDFFA